jgi:hypothetical protein
MSFPYMSQRDLRFVRLYDAYKDALTRYEKAITEYTFYYGSQWKDREKLAEEKLAIAKQNAEDAKKEFVEFAKVNKI